MGWNSGIMILEYIQRSQTKFKFKGDIKSVSKWHNNYQNAYFCMLEMPLISYCRHLIPSHHFHPINHMHNFLTINKTLSNIHDWRNM